MVVKDRPTSKEDDECHQDGWNLMSQEDGLGLPEGNDEQGIGIGSGSDHDKISDVNDNPAHDDDNFIIVEAENGVLQSLQDLSLENHDIQTERKSLDDNGELLKAPDGGYGWAICLGVFMNHMIYGGLSRCDGLFFLQFKSKFDSSAQLTAWPGSLMSTLNLFMGPVCGALVNRYSVRTAFFIGTLLCFAGMLLNGFATNIYFLFLSHTLLGGIGRGLMSGILLLNLYFDKHRSLATGFGTSGVGAGSLWVVPLTQFLFDEFTFTGSFLILSGLCLQGFVMAMLFRPLSMHYRFLKAKKSKHQTKEIAEENIALTVKDDMDHPFSEIDSKLHSNLEQFVTGIETGKFSEKKSTIQIKFRQNEENVQIKNNNNLTSSVLTQPLKETVVTVENSIESLHLNSESEKKLKSDFSNSDDDTCCRSSLKICFPIEFKQKGAEKKKKVFHWDLLFHLPFMIFCISNFLFILAFKTAFTFLPAIAMSKGLSEQEAALVLTISGALDTFGRLASGFIMDFRPLRVLRPFVFNLLLFFIAAASLLVPSLTTFASFSIVAAMYGFMTGAFIAQKMVVLVDILGREKMPSSLGIQKVFQGFGTLIGPPLSGALKDILGNYDSSFYLGGASMFCAGLILVVSTILLRIQNKKLSQKTKL